MGGLMSRSRCSNHLRYARGCPDCRVCARDYRRARVAGLIDGTWERQKPSPELRERGRQHLLALQAVKGVSNRRIATVAGVNLNTVRWVATGALHQGVSAVSVEALLGVTAAACLALIDRSTTPVDPTGTARRLQALAVDGWSAQMLSPLVGLDESTIRYHRSHTLVEITVGIRERYRELYDKIQSQPDPRGGSERARLNAEGRGWPGPECWPEEDIDDPGAQPLPPPPDTDDWALVSRQIDDALRDPRPGKAADYPRPVQREIARQARGRLGWSYEQVAELLGKSSTNAVDYLLNGRKDRPRTRRDGAA